MNLSFGFSPCPNDTFMFEPIVARRIDTEGLAFDIHLADVETLNKEAISQGPDITKLSFNAFTSVIESYQMLSSGAALGRKCGPLLISKTKFAPEDPASCQIAIPGKYTTAFLLLKYAYPQLTQFTEMVFSDIEEAVLSGQVDAGVIIHENRFTYAEKGLYCWKDLGEYWEENTGFPIPLGGIAVRRSLPETVKKTIARVIQRSVVYAMDHPDSGSSFVQSHAQEMDPAVMQAHIDLYVSQYSKVLGDEGKQAVYHLCESVLPQWNEKIKHQLFVSE
jgi:1,4-dihydroxy-6-naphthoate synthase